MKAPFPYAGGKSRIAHEIWARFGELKRYIDPFCGSLAVPLLAPIPPRAEIFNDANGLLVNAWRAIRAAPDEVYYHAQRPQAENELNAIHAAMRRREPSLVAEIEADEAYYDAEVAGWWVWGMCAEYSGNWSKPTRPNSVPHLTNYDGVSSKQYTRRVMRQVSRRIQRARITCGDWLRAVTHVAMTHHASPTNTTGVLLDPPYATERRASVYGKHDTTDLADTITDFCLQWGDDNRVRIILCGYEGEYPALEAAGWRVVAWQTNGGYGNQGNGQGRANKYKERLWCSPHCIVPARQLSLFGD